MIIYIAAPYSNGNIELNVKKALAYADVIINSGHTPLCPHLFHYLNKLYPQTEEKWKELDLNLLKKCDALIRLEGESKGADDEMEFARKNHIPVSYLLYQIFL